MVSKSNRISFAKTNKDTDDGISIKRKCELLGVARTSAYNKPAKVKVVSKEQLDEKEARMRIIDEIHLELPATGARKMAWECTNAGYPTTRYQAQRIMEEMNIKTIYPKPNLSKPAKHHKKIPYLIADKSKIRRPNQVWSIDITYIPYGRTHMYLTAIIDWHTKRIMAWELSDTLDTAPVLDCVKSAVKSYGSPEILNSDQGSQFTSNDYIDLLSNLSIKQSMDGKGRWVDNRAIERWWRTLKSEYLRINEFETPRELRLGIKDFVTLYNDKRLHESIDYLTPREFYEVEMKKAA